MQVRTRASRGAREPQRQRGQGGSGRTPGAGGCFSALRLGRGGVVLPPRGTGSRLAPPRDASPVFSLMIQQPQGKGAAGT